MKIRFHNSLLPTRTCPLCRDAIRRRSLQRVRACVGCRTHYHEACAEELGGCATLGCDARALPVDRMRRLDGYRTALVDGVVRLVRAEAEPAVHVEPRPPAQSTSAWVGFLVALGMIALGAFLGWLVGAIIYGAGGALFYPEFPGALQRPELLTYCTVFGGGLGLVFAKLSAND